MFKYVYTFYCKLDHFLFETETFLPIYNIFLLRFKFNV